jgi:hypothetical protein
MGLINKYLLIYETSRAEYEQANPGGRTVTHAMKILQEQYKETGE